VIDSVESVVSRLSIAGSKRGSEGGVVSSVTVTFPADESVCAAFRCTTRSE
jgi:hypothetical protein